MPALAQSSLLGLARPEIDAVQLSFMEPVVSSTSMMSSGGTPPPRAPDVAVVRTVSVRKPSTGRKISGTFAVANILTNDVPRAVIVQLDHGSAQMRHVDDVQLGVVWGTGPTIFAAGSQVVTEGERTQHLGIVVWSRDRGQTWTKIAGIDRRFEIAMRGSNDAHIGLDR